MSDSIAAPLLRWYDQHGRHDLPWQKNRNAYTVWVSEIMLQQTQVATVIPYYLKFIQQFPTVKDLAEASVDTVLQYWAGLGYYARGRNLHKAAQIVLQEHAAEMPVDFEALHSLPGIGRSTAAAIMAQAYQQPYAILDGNVKRVLSRLYCVPGWPGNKKVADKLWVFAEQNTPIKRVDDYTQAIMDLGATLCKRSKPHCEACPLNHKCLAYEQNSVADYPAKKPKKVLPVKSVQMLMVSRDGSELLLEKRPPAGIWGGLFSFPEVPIEQDCTAWWQQSAYAALGQLEIEHRCPQIRHSFSHYHLDIIPVMAKIAATNVQGATQESACHWHKIGEEAGLPAPVTKLMMLYT